MVSRLRLDRGISVVAPSRPGNNGCRSNVSKRAGWVTGGGINGAALVGGVIRAGGAAGKNEASSGAVVASTTGALSGTRGAGGAAVITGGGGMRGAGGAAVVNREAPGSKSVGSAAGVAGGLLRAGITVPAVVTGTGAIIDTAGGHRGESRAAGVERVAVGNGRVAVGIGKSRNAVGE